MPVCSRPRSPRLQAARRRDLRTPAARPATPALIVRDGRGFVPKPTAMLRAGDRLLIVACAAVREQTEQRLRAVGPAGKLAGWFGEHGLRPATTCPFGSHWASNHIRRRRADRTPMVGGKGDRSD